MNNGTEGKGNPVAVLFNMNGHSGCPGEIFSNNCFAFKKLSGLMIFFLRSLKYMFFLNP